MDPISKLIAAWKIPVGKWGKSFIDFIVTYFDWFFDALSDGLGWIVEGSTFLLLQIPAFLLALMIAGLAYWLQKSKTIAFAVLLGLLFIINQNLWKETVQTLVLVVAATALSMAIGVPIGIWAAHKPRVWRVTQPILDLMQTMPTFVYLIPILILFGLGAAPALIVTIIFAMPAPVRMTYLGITSIPKPMIEAGESFGATKRQLLWKVELPAALPVDHGRPHPVHHALALHGRLRHADRRAEPWQSGQQGARQPQHSARHRGGPGAGHPRHHP